MNIMLECAQLVRDNVRNVHTQICIDKLTEKAITHIKYTIKHAASCGWYSCSFSTHTESDEERFVWSCFEENISGYPRYISKKVHENIMDELASQCYYMETFNVITGVDCYRIGWGDDEDEQ